MTAKIKTIALTLAMVLFSTVLLAGCGKDTTYAMEVDGEKVPAGVYIGYLINSYRTAAGQVKGESDMFSQQIDGKDVADWIRDEAILSSKKYVAINKKFEEMGLTLNDVDKQVAEQSVASTWNYFGSFYEDQGCSKASFEKIQENQVKASRIFYALYSAGGDKEVPTDEIKAFYLENFLKFDYLEFPLIDSSYVSLPDEKKDAIRAMADKYMELAKTETDFAKIINGATEEMAKLMDQTVSDDDKATEGTPTYTVMYKDDTSVPEVLRTALQKAGTGDVGIVDNGNQSLLLYKKYDIGEVEEDFTSAMNTALARMKNDEYEDLLAEWGEGYNTVLNDAAIKRYKSTNLKAK